MKIGFATDTNLLKKTDDKIRVCEKTLDETEIFIEYIEALSKTESDKELIYYMPSIVIEELFSQKKQIFEEQYKLLQERFNNIGYGLIGELPKNNFDEIVKKEKKEYITKYKNINLKYSEELFESLINDALAKKPPFDKSLEGQKTDAGFKDALIWKTILYSEDVGECDLFYFFSSDKVFSDNIVELSKEFSEFHKDTDIKIVFLEPDGNQRQNALQLIISDNKLVETNVVKLYNKELILSSIKSINYDYDKDIFYSEDEQIKVNDVLFNEFSYEDFIINDVNEKGSEYEVEISFETHKYTLSNSQEEKSKALLGYIKIYYIIEKGDIKFKSFTIEEVRFYRNNINKLISSLSESFTKIYSDEFRESMDKLKKSLEFNLEPLKNIDYSNQFQEIKNSMSAISSLQEITKSINSLNQFKELQNSINSFDVTKNAFSSLKTFSNTNLLKTDENDSNNN